MTDFEITASLLSAVFCAGALRVYTDKNILIFYITSFAASVMVGLMVLDHFGFLFEWALYLGTLLLFVSGVVLSACNTKYVGGNQL
tara:strand:- start:2306 stop:2563 length:258 start_codon:yes stop_codon:yes gene_type:complete